MPLKLSRGTPPARTSLASAVLVVFLALLTMLTSLTVTGCGAAREDGTADGMMAPVPRSGPQGPGTGAGALPGDAGAGALPDGGDRTSWCATEAFTAELRPLRPSAGTRYGALVLTNTSGATCRTQGWPGLQLATEDGTDLPTTTVRDRSRGPRPLTVRPGERAWARLRWSTVPGDGDPADGGCGPLPAVLWVIAPDAYHAEPAEWDHGPVCGDGRITALALEPGTGPEG